MPFDTSLVDSERQPSRRRFLRGLGIGALALAAAPVIAACGGSQPTSAGAQTGGAKTAPAATPAAGGKTAPASGGTTVEMNDQNRFVPAAITVKKGTTVTWKNAGQTMPHNVVTDPNLAIDKAHAKVPTGAQPFTSPMLTPGQSWQHTFDVVGEYAYFCQPHEALGMLGTVTVTE